MLKNTQNIEKILGQARKKQQEMSHQLVEKAKKELETGKDVDEVIEKLAHQISQKILHTPLKRVKNLADSTNDEKQINLIRQIFNYDE